MTRSSDSDDSHRAVSKNGKDREQDRALRDLRADWASWKEDHARWQRDDEEIHRGLESGVTEIQKKLYAAGIVGRIIWVIVAAVASTLVGFLAWIASQNASLRDELHQHITFGEERGRVIMRELDECAEEIKELRRRVRQGE